LCLSDNNCRSVLLLFEKILKHPLIGAVIY
jgi:hypothetical protein